MGSEIPYQLSANHKPESRATCRFGPVLSNLKGYAENTVELRFVLAELQMSLNLPQSFGAAAAQSHKLPESVSVPLARWSVETICINMFNASSSRVQEQLTDSSAFTSGFHIVASGAGRGSFTSAVRQHIEGTEQHRHNSECNITW